MYKEGRIQKPEMAWLVREATRLLQAEPNLLELRDPLTIVGDIHGQYYDLLKILELGGDPEKNRYLFLGDYVDRGAFSIEALILLYSLKVCYPKNVFLLRGNHECLQLTTHFNFREECLAKFDQEIY
jgi:serine/threonine-protein phosphatase 2B catalytic subunit